MKQPTPFFTLAIFFAITSSSSFAQRSADWSVNLTGKAQQIIIQQLTGVPIVQTDKAYIGIDPAGQKVAWTVERKAAKIISAAEGYDFYNMAGTPFVLINNNVIESLSGTAVISKDKNNYKYIDDYEVIPALNNVLVRVTASGGMLRLYLIGMKDARVTWETDVMKPSLITGMNEEPEEEHVDVPLNTSLVSSDNHLIYRYRKNLAVISPQGKLLWIEKADPAEVMLSPDGKKVITVKALVTGIGNSPVSVRYVTKYRSAKMQAFDLKTGKESWKAESQWESADALEFVTALMPPARVEAFKQSRDFAWYFTKDKSANVLVKVNKDTGAEVDKLIFDDARPVYQVDEIQRRVYYASNNVLKVF